jgi:hypothetical protein
VRLPPNVKRDAAQLSSVPIPGLEMHRYLEVSGTTGGSARRPSPGTAASRSATRAPPTPPRPPPATWEEIPPDDGERALAEVADWGPAEDWWDWADAAG